MPEFGVGMGAGGEWVPDVPRAEFDATQAILEQKVQGLLDRLDAHHAWMAGRNLLEGHLSWDTCPVCRELGSYAVDQVHPAPDDQEDGGAP